jgi:uncharacterized protein (TIGR01777 family)
MTTLITGATGLLGTLFLHEYCREQDAIIALVRDPESARKRLPPFVSTITWEELESPGSDSLRASIDRVIHLAGESIASGSWTPERKKRILDSRVETARRLIRLLPRQDLRWISASAVGFYGDRGAELLTVDSPPGTGFLSEVCQAWEGVAQELPDPSRAVFLRFGVILSWRGGALPKMALPIRLGGGLWMGSGDQYFPHIDERDACLLLRRCLDEPSLRGPINAVAPEMLTLKEFTQRLGRQLHRPVWGGIPAPILRLVLGEMSHLFLDSQKVAATFSPKPQ